MSLTSVKMTEEVWLTCLTHALSTETEEILGLLLGDIEVFIFIFSLHNNQAIPFQFFIYYMCFLFVFFIGCAVFLGYSLKLCNFLTTCLNGNGIEFVFFLVLCFDGDFRNPFKCFDSHFPKFEIVNCLVYCISF